MKRKPLITIFLIFVIIAVLTAMALPIFSKVKGREHLNLRIDVLDLGNALNVYREKYASYPTGENSNIVGVLAGDNPQKIIFLNYRRTPEHPNEMVDPWGTPYQIHFSQQTNFIISSAGKDKIFGDADDFIFNGVSNDFVKP
jgi:type II secretory pathway pseudopilin PulG